MDKELERVRLECEAAKIKAAKLELRYIKAQRLAEIARLDESMEKQDAAEKATLEKLALLEIEK